MSLKTCSVSVLLTQCAYHFDHLLVIRIVISGLLIVNHGFRFRLRQSCRLVGMVAPRSLVGCSANRFSESELLLVTRSNDNHSPGPVMREVSP